MKNRLDPGFIGTPNQIAELSKDVVNKEKPKSPVPKLSIIHERDSSKAHSSLYKNVSDPKSA